MNDKQTKKLAKQVGKLQRMAGEINRQATTFHVGSEELQRVDGVVHLPLGTGILGGGGEMYRVVDSWLSLDDHGRFGRGMHIFMVPATRPNTLTLASPDDFPAEEAVTAVEPMP